MFSPGNILYYNGFPFPNGSPSKPKYFIIIKLADDNMVAASLPTSHDHIPNSLSKVHGCIDHAGMCINCYYFEQGRIISECGEFGFPRDTYMYGEQVDLFDRDLYEKRCTYKILCRLTNDEYQAIIHCLRLSKSIKNKIKKLL